MENRDVLNKVFIKQSSIHVQCVHFEIKSSIHEFAHRVLSLVVSLLQFMQTSSKYCPAKFITPKADSSLICCLKRT